MAKKQTFGDKVKGQDSKKQNTYIKIVKAVTPDSASGIRFSEEIIGVSPDENVDNFVKKYLTESK
ncbi:MAG: hypothetical protein ISR90_05355 [Candidatus Marinimicrobia bacterium]|nr:hypothetical protein [Candidatus Neomarinimicrobiota bacterium]MBL7023463.1 hypothetical protein [Candidatus Neomarinimicrobiota bacterium]MBL7109282.1 hypothetical protein [Candidatus Neomarinimicrobiota bacterium]